MGSGYNEVLARRGLLLVSSIWSEFDLPSDQKFSIVTLPKDLLVGRTSCALGSPVHRS